MSKPKILMLGWEFPPMINGGLGVACKGLSEALAQRTDLTFIVPNTNLENSPYQLIGLQNKKIIIKFFLSYIFKHKYIHKYNCYYKTIFKLTN